MLNNLGYTLTEILEAKKLWLQEFKKEEFIYHVSQPEYLNEIKEKGLGLKKDKFGPKNYFSIYIEKEYSDDGEENLLVFILEPKKINLSLIYPDPEAFFLEDDLKNESEAVNIGLFGEFHKPISYWQEKNMNLDLLYLFALKYSDIYHFMYNEIIKYNDCIVRIYENDEIIAESKYGKKIIY